MYGITLKSYLYLLPLISGEERVQGTMKTPTNTQNHQASSSTIQVEEPWTGQLENLWAR